MPIEDVHYALPFEMMKAGYEAHGSRFFAIGYTEFLQGVNTNSIPQTKMSLQMMSRFSEITELLLARSERSESDVAFIKWISNIALDFSYNRASCYYSDIAHGENSVAPYSVYSDESVSKEYEHLYRVRSRDIALIYAEHITAKFPPNRDSYKKNYQRNIEHYERSIQMIDNGEVGEVYLMPKDSYLSSIRDAKRFIDWHLRSDSALVDFEFDNYFHRVYNEIGDVKRLWQKAYESKHGILIAQG
jgi:hypothetical protein